MQKFKTINGEVECFEDENGLVYTADKKTLLKCRNADFMQRISNNGNLFPYGYHDRFLDIHHSKACILEDGLTFDIGNGPIVIQLPEGLVSIEHIAFECCYALRRVKMPDSMVSIGFKAFANCGNLTDIVLSAGLKSIGGWAFENCENLIGIEIPAGVTKIEEKTFTRCKNLQYIALPSELTSIDGRYESFEDCNPRIYIICPSDADKDAIKEKFREILPGKFKNNFRLCDAGDPVY